MSGVTSVLKIVTNNLKVQKYCIDNAYLFDFVQGHAQEVLFATREFLLQKWKLAADPLAGHLSRPNPYHTVILQKNLQTEPIAEDILRIETALCQWYLYTNVIELTDRLYRDYCELDFSLAVNTLQGLLKSSLY